MDDVQKSQENQYHFPYHYIPINAPDGFKQAVSWSWGMHYLAGIEAVIAQLKKYHFESIIDIGCGDGRFLREVSNHFILDKAIGVDYSTRAISLAQAMNPNLDYRCLDITHQSLEERFDIATMIEVLEHIPPPNINAFLKEVATHINPNGLLILTVPHENKTLQEKHYQHFTTESLTKFLNDDYYVEKIIPFDRISRLKKRLIRLLGYSGKNYVITNKAMLNWAYGQVLEGCLKPQSEKECSRLLAIARVQNS